MINLQSTLFKLGLFQCQDELEWLMHSYAFANSKKKKKITEKDGGVNGKIFHSKE